MHAVRIGGRVGCLSALQSAEVFVFQNTACHVVVAPNASRLRSAFTETTRLRRLDDRTPCVVHWAEPVDGASSSDLFTGIVDALAQSLFCQPPRMSVASIDSALNLRLVSNDEVAALFSQVPERFRSLAPLIDGRAESGPETILRLLLRAAGYEFEIQVVIDGIGRVDFVVEGVVLVEVDSRAHHEGWEKQKRDRRRDLVAAELGYMSLRPLYEDVMFDGQRVIRAIAGLLAGRRAIIV